MSLPRHLQRCALAGSTLALTALISAQPVSAHDPASVSVSAAAPTAFDAMACPVTRHADFSDSWGDPRSGGRRHEGVDIAAERGTPIVAALTGSAEFKNTSAGGKSVWLTTPSGDKFFYAHLDAWEGESREVDQGDVLGYVGSTGNAGGPHLHFEIRPGGAAVNPYLPTSAACERQSQRNAGIGARRGGGPGLLMVR